MQEAVQGQSVAGSRQPWTHGPVGVEIEVPSHFMCGEEVIESRFTNQASPRSGLFGSTRLFPQTFLAGWVFIWILPHFCFAGCKRPCGGIRMVQEVGSQGCEAADLFMPAGTTEGNGEQECLRDTITAQSTEMTWRVNLDCLLQRFAAMFYLDSPNRPFPEPVGSTKSASLGRDQNWGGLGTGPGCRTRKPITARWREHTLWGPCP